MNKSSDQSRERILARGVDLLSVRGLSGVTVGGLAEEVGMSKSGLFGHFRSKDEIQLALLRRSVEIIRGAVVEPALAVEAGLPRLRAFMRGWFGWTTRAGLTGGCPVAAALFELDDLEGPVRDYLVEVDGQVRRLLAKMTRQAVATGDLKAELDVDQFAWELIGIYLAHHVSLRFVGDVGADGRAWAAFERLVRHARP